MKVFVEECEKYDSDKIYFILKKYEVLFKENIKQGDIVVIKPNWISESHIYNKLEWEQVITHPSIITAVLKVVLRLLNGNGKVIITDGPLTSANWGGIMKLMEVEQWKQMGKNMKIEVNIIDLREDEWVTKGGLIVDRKKLKGDPLGSTICNLAQHSEFVGKKSSRYGFFGADYNKNETNEAHSSGNHYYKVSKTVIEADVFINLPKLKAHKKAGITCSLKNLVGINTYKNWLPHHTEGTPKEGGDQFPVKNIRSSTEGIFVSGLYNFLANKPHLAKFFIPMKKVGKFVFGDTRKTIRNGSWYGNDTLWRTVLDLNKILFYANSDGSLRADVPSYRKRYISIVDAVISGEGNGPDAPDKKHTGFLILGTDPVSVDAVCAKLMGFDWKKIPIIKNSFLIKRYSICDNRYNDISLESSLERFNKPLSEIRKEDTFRFRPSVGWLNHIEEV